MTKEAILVGSMGLVTGVVAGLLTPLPVSAGPPSDLDLSTPAAIYRAACAACHGSEGRGAPVHEVGFADPSLPDFTDCSFASREPLGDWFAVVHAGGPVRGFSDRMPAFGAALTDAQIEMALEHVYGFCEEDTWPRGELNLPRPLVTEKAYPEDEAVWTTTADVEGSGAVSNEVLYEKRFGSRSQVEVKLPFGLRESVRLNEWVGGIGDLTVGVKRAFAHDLEKGMILSAGAEVVLPTGDADDGFGKDTVILEPFAAAGFLLRGGSFLHLQAGAELSTDTAKADHEAFYRAAFGTTLAQGPEGFGRAWTPMLEVLVSTEFGDETETHLDLLPQLQVTLNTRQHVMANLGVRFPVTDAGQRDTRVIFYLLWDWFDGGLFEGW